LLTRLVEAQIEDHPSGAKGGKIYLLNWRDSSGKPIGTSF